MLNLNGDQFKIPLESRKDLFGIVIRMFMEVEAQHNIPHFHAYYQEHVAVFGIETGDLLAETCRYVRVDWLGRGWNCIEMS